MCWIQLVESWAFAEARYAGEYTCWEPCNAVLVPAVTVTNNFFLLLFGGVLVPPIRTGSCRRVSRVAFLWTSPLYPSVGAVMNFCHGNSSLCCFLWRSVKEQALLGEVWQQTLSALHTNSPQTQPTLCLSTQLTDYISVSSSEFASRVSGLLWDFLHWTLSYPRRKGCKHLILILQTFDFWLSLKVDWMKLVVPLFFQEAINCTAITRTTCHSFFHCCGSIVPKCSFYLRGARVSAKNV